MLLSAFDLFALTMPGTALMRGTQWRVEQMGSQLGSFTSSWRMWAGEGTMGTEIKMESHVQRPSGHKGYDMEEELEELTGDLGSCRGVTGRNVAGPHLTWPGRPSGSSSSTQIVGSQ